MKVFQILGNFCYVDVTPQFPTVESTKGYFPTDVAFVEAPDYVFSGWGYVNGQFIKPTPPEGWLYDETNGTFYQESSSQETEPIDFSIDQMIVAIVEGVNSV